MHRVSSLGLPPTAIPVIQKCLRAPGMIVGPRFLIHTSRSTATRCSVPPHEGKRLDTENFRLDGVARSVVLPSREENPLRSKISSEEQFVEELTSKEESKSTRKRAGQENAAATNIPLQDTIGHDQLVSQAVEGEISQEIAQRPSFFIQDAPFLSGRPWARQPVQLLRTPSKNDSKLDAASVIPSIDDGDAIVQNMLHVLATTTSAEEGWRAYGVLSRMQWQQNSPSGGIDTVQIVPFAHLHRLARIIARNVPKTRPQFLRLLSVLSAIQNYGGAIHIHEWNALIDHAGKGYRRTHSENFYGSLSIYYDMIYDRPPGSGFFSDHDFGCPREDDPSALPSPKNPAAEPDIYTYTTLIDIAARTGHPSLLHRATTLLKEAGLSPNRITHLALLKFFTARKQLSGIRTTLARMREQNLDIGVDELNACMWAYGQSSRVDIVIMIYRALRHNMVPEDYVGDGDITSVQECLRGEGILVPSDLWPNKVTFTSMIQIMAYYGNFLATQSVFNDMLSTPNSEQGAPLVLDENGELQRTLYVPTISVFRAIFLGFCRNGINSNSCQTSPPHLDPSEPEWNLENLQTFFETFLNLPLGTKVTESTLFWLLRSFSKLSNYDVQLLRTTWSRTEDRFGPFKWGPDHRLTKWRRRLFP